MTKSFNINALIQKGKELVEEYELPAGKVYVRPITDLEMNEAQSIIFETIEDPATKNYMMGMGDGKTSDIPEDIDIMAILTANNAVNTQIAYVAMRDFTDGLTTALVQELCGINDLADFIRDISGYALDSKEVVEDFR